MVLPTSAKDCVAVDDETKVDAMCQFLFDKRTKFEAISLDLHGKGRKDAQHVSNFLELINFFFAVSC